MSWAPNRWTLTQGGSGKIVAILLDESGDLLNISGATAIKASFKKADGTLFEKTSDSGWAYGDPTETLWAYGFTLTAEEVASLPVAKGQTVMIKVCFGDTLCKCYLIPGSLTVRTITL